MNTLYFTIRIFLQLTPCIFLIVLTFKNHLRVSLALINCLAILLIFLSGVASYLIRLHDPYGGKLHLLYSLIFMLVYLALYFSCIKTPLYQSVFVLFIIKTYSDMIMLFSDLLAINFSSGLLPLGTRSIFLLAQLILQAISIPPMWLFMVKLIKPLIDNSGHLPFWKYLWAVPVSYYAILNFILAPGYLQDTRILEKNNFFLPCIWAIVTFLTYFIILQMLSETNKSTKLAERLQIADLQIAMQKDQYEILQGSIEYTKRIQHDLRHHILAMKGYTANKDYSGLETYLDSYLKNLDNDKISTLCENHAINAIANYYANLAGKHNIDLKIKLNIPKELGMLETDLCIVLGNLLENAVEACSNQKQSHRFILFNMGISGKKMIAISIENSYEQEIKRNNLSFLSSKRKGEGIGISSVQYIAEKYSGLAKFQYQDGIFKASVLLNP